MPRRYALVLILAGLAYGQTADFAIDRSVLPNGMELLLHTDRKAPIVHLNFRFRVGAKHESAGQYGLAHLFEHLFYENRDGTPISTAAEQIGATALGGTTLPDYTEFSETVPVGSLERMLWMEANRFSRFREDLTQQKLDRQREVVINERRLRVENEPYNRTDPLFCRELFPPGHPYHHDVGGEPADLASITLDDVRAFYNQHYTPDQLTLAMVGDFDPAQVKQWVEKYFGSIAPGDEVVAPTASAPPLGAPKSIRMDARVRAHRVYFAWVGPALASRDGTALAFAEMMLTDDFSPRHLHKGLTDKLSLGVSTDYSRFQDASIFYIYVTVAPGASVKAIDDNLGEQLARLARDGPTDEEMERTRNRLESSRLGDLESIAGTASVLQDVRLFYGSTDRWNEWSGRYSSITADEIRAAVGRWLVAPSHVAIDVRPQTAVRSTGAESDRSTPPPLQPNKPFRIPEIQAAKLPNGLQILVLERHDLAKVAVRLQFRAGAVMAPPDKPGLNLLAGAAAKGSTSHQEDAMQRALVDLGANIGGHADLNALDLHLDVLSKNLDPAFRLMAEGLLHTYYPDWSVEAWKKDWVEQIEKPEASLDDYSRELYSAAFGSNHPLGRGWGTADSLRALTPADVRAFHDRYWKPDIAALIFVGDVTLQQAVALATDALGGWIGAAPPTPKIPPPAPQHDRIVFVDRKGVTQTMVVQVLPGVPRDHPDYPALTLADRIYGGMSSSRIWENIREQHGIAYYAHSGLDIFPTAGLWTVYSPVQTDSVALAMREFQNELAAFGRTRPITQAELDQAKASIIRSQPEDFETLGSAASTIGWNWAWGLPVSELHTFSARIEALTLEQVNAVARKYARLDQAFFLLVGDRQKIEPQLRDFH